MLTQRLSFQERDLRAVQGIVDSEEQRAARQSGSSVPGRTVQNLQAKDLFIPPGGLIPIRYADLDMIDAVDTECVCGHAPLLSKRRFCYRNPPLVAVLSITAKGTTYGKANLV